MSWLKKKKDILAKYGRTFLGANVIFHRHDRMDKPTAHAQTKWRRRVGKRHTFENGPKNQTNNDSGI